MIKPLRKPTTVAKNMLNCENLNTFLKIGNKSRIFAFTTYMQVFSRSITQRITVKKNNSDIWKGEK